MSSLASGFGDNVTQIHKIGTIMTKILLGKVIIMAILVSFSLNGPTMASEDIYALRIENISKSGADFYWSTPIATKGSIEYAYTKLAELYNPQSSGSQQSVSMTVVPVRVKSESGYRKEHHIRLDDLDMYYDPFVQYTIKSETESGEVYTLSGEFVLADTGVIRWWQTSYFVVSLAIISVLGFILTIRKYVQSRKAKRGVAPLD